MSSLLTPQYDAWVPPGTHGTVLVDGLGNWWLFNGYLNCWFIAGPGVEGLRNVDTRALLYPSGVRGFDSGITYIRDSIGISGYPFVPREPSAVVAWLLED